MTFINSILEKNNQFWSIFSYRKSSRLLKGSKIRYFIEFYLDLLEKLLWHDET